MYSLRNAIRVSMLVFAIASSAWAQWVDGNTSKIVDGDTIWIEKSSETTLKIRMIGMDTPETHLPTANGVVGQQPWGDKAANYLANLLPLNKRVSVDDHGMDKYKRVLGRIYFRDVDVNLEMVESGWAVPYIICEGPSCDAKFLERENVEDYVAACERARSAKRGIFSRTNPLKEMPFEFRMRVQNRKPEKYVGDFETMEYFDPEDYKKVDLCQRIFFLTKKAAAAAGFTYAGR